MATRIQLRRGVSASWTGSNPTLFAGELGFETDTGKFKIGNGSTAWNSLSYAASTPLEITTQIASSSLPLAASANYLTIAASANFYPLNILTNAQTGTSYTLAASDSGRIIEMNNASSNLVIVPLNSTVPFPIGTKIDIVQTGAGATSASFVSGVTLNSDTNKRTVNVQWAAVSLVKRGTDTWLLLGALKA
jgi:hypothetical protein